MYGRQDLGTSEGVIIFDGFLADLDGKDGWGGGRRRRRRRTHRGGGEGRLLIFFYRDECNGGTTSSIPYKMICQTMVSLLAALVLFIYVRRHRRLHVFNSNYNSISSWTCLY
jgi:hypothetical protein